jgi:hypothetical protein
VSDCGYKIIYEKEIAKREDPRPKTADQKNKKKIIFKPEPRNNFCSVCHESFTSYFSVKNSLCSISVILSISSSLLNLRPPVLSRIWWCKCEVRVGDGRCGYETRSGDGVQVRRLGNFEVS